ncbi:uncharacterized protein A4U43_C05F12770 [Asparagus officinalis]|uniref:Uncharacterized protein n=1 Tax=Asparagus officinalis TaxID=4686 RepID=A0A5P1EUX6_ASPOF|nr:uncharacterized protein A4U43_C05F12770 [Asparagus officinalis]
MERCAEQSRGRDLTRGRWPRVCGVRVRAALRRGGWRGWRSLRTEKRSQCGAGRGRRRGARGGMVPSYLLILSLLLLSTIPSSLSYILSSKRPITTIAKGDGDGTPDWREIGLRSECMAKSRWCRWCRSKTLDNMCFGSVEAWSLPHQVFSYNPSSTS